MRFVFSESTADRRAELALKGVETTLALGALVAGGFLVFGYDEALRSLDIGLGWRWFLGMLAAVLVLMPGGLALCFRKTANAIGGWIRSAYTTRSDECAWLPALLAGVWFFLLPTTFYHVISNVVEHTTRPHAILVTMLSALWAGVSLAALGVVAVHRPSAHAAQPRMGIAEGVVGDVHVVTFTGIVDSDTAPAVRAALRAAALRRANKVCVVDLTAATFFASSGVAALIEAGAECLEKKGNPLRVVVASDCGVIGPIAITGLEHVLAFHHSIDEALAAGALVAPLAAAGSADGLASMKPTR